MLITKLETRDRVYTAANIRIGRTRETKKLYEVEAARQDAIKKATDELIKVLDINRAAFWTDGLPIALLNILESWDAGASCTAGKAKSMPSVK